MSAPRVFHGEWWVPAKRVRENGGLVVYSEGPGKKFTGTLTYWGEKESVLELYHVPSDFFYTLYHENEIMWGQDTKGRIYTLFRVNIKQDKSDISNTVFAVDFILIGEHVSQIDDACFAKCIVQFPFLRNWAFRNNLEYQKTDGVYYFSLVDSSRKDNFVESQIDEKTKWLLRDKWDGNKTNYDLTITQKTEFVIESLEGVSVYVCLRQIIEFSQFLSIALYCEQSPSSILLVNKDNHRGSTLLFEIDNSTDPQNKSLIQFNELHNKIPMMLQKWHECYESISPISKYLITSLGKNRYFDAPDFLIIAQALDGYFKRFYEKKIDEKIRRYEKQIEILLNRFKDIDVIKSCHINPDVLTDSRHKYSHLLPDEAKPKAVDGEDLYDLTEKSKILLICCILDLLGLSIDEINLCLNASPIKELAEKFDLEERMMS